MGCTRGALEGKVTAGRSVSHSSADLRIPEDHVEEEEHAIPGVLPKPAGDDDDVDDDDDLQRAPNFRGVLARGDVRARLAEQERPPEMARPGEG